MYSLFEKYIFNRIDGVIVPCSINGKDPFRGIKTNHIYLNNYPSLKEFGEVNDRTHRNEEDSVCYIGAITEERGINNMVIATYKAGTPLLLAGNFTPKSLQDELKEMKEFKNVKYYGFADRNKAHEILQRSSIGISVIKNIGQYCIADNFPTKVYEYLGAGLPVVVSETPFIKQENEKYKFGIAVNPDDVEAISNAIKYLIDNPVEAYEMGKRGRKLVENTYNWESEVRKLIALYNTIFQN
jgi:glycosyltransferase involved in cell wall biosynthesis